MNLATFPGFCKYIQLHHSFVKSRGTSFYLIISFIAEQRKKSIKEKVESNDKKKILIKNLFSKFPVLTDPGI